MQLLITTAESCLLLFLIVLKSDFGPNNTDGTRSRNLYKKKLAQESMSDMPVYWASVRGIIIINVCGIDSSSLRVGSESKTVGFFWGASTFGVHSTDEQHYCTMSTLQLFCILLLVLVELLSLLAYICSSQLFVNCDQFCVYFYMCDAAFKKEFQKLGDSFMALAKSFEFDARPGHILVLFAQLLL